MRLCFDFMLYKALPVSKRALLALPLSRLQLCPGNTSGTISSRNGPLPPLIPAMGGLRSVPVLPHFAATGGETARNKFFYEAKTRLAGFGSFEVGRQQSSFDGRTAHPKRTSETFLTQRRK